MICDAQYVSDTYFSEIFGRAVVVVIV